MNILFVGYTEREAWRRAMAIAPFPTRSLHHTISSIGVREEFATARKTGDCLFLPDLYEFPKAIMDQIAGELDKGEVDIIATSTKCPCGFWPGGECRCTESQKMKWNARLTDALKAKFIIKEE